MSFRNILVGTPARRGEIWQSWITNGEIELSDGNLFYVLRHRAEILGRRIDRWALFCALDVHEKRLFIHEDVFPDGVERARQATEACESDMAPIFLGCDEGMSRQFRMWLEAGVQGQDPFLVYRESDESIHEVWSLGDGVPLKQLLELFDDSAPVFLLDGHHRLAAARENLKIGIGDGKILACLCSMGATDTLILPIHRTVRYERWMLPETFMADLSRAGCKIRELPDLKVSAIPEYLEKTKAKEPFAVALHSHASAPVRVQFPNSKKLPLQLAALSVAGLDFTLLEEHPQASGIPQPGFELALEHLASDQSQVAFFLPAAKPSEVRAIALSHLKMPRKSTRFMPKPALGLIFRPWTSCG